MISAEAVLKYRTEGQQEALRGARDYASAAQALADRAARAAQAQAMADAALRRASQAFKQGQADLDAYSQATARAANGNDVQAASAANLASAVEDSARRQAAAVADVDDAQAKAAQAIEKTTKAANDNGSALGTLAEHTATALEIAVKHPIATAAAAAAGAKALSALSDIASSKLDEAAQVTKRYAEQNREMGGKVAAAAAVASDGLSVAASGASSAASGFAALAERMNPASAGAGILARALGGIAPLVPVITAGIAGFGLAALAIERANADLDRLVKLAERAESLELGATFVASFDKLGEKMEIGADRVQAALERASTLLRDKYGQGNPLTKALGEYESGGDAAFSARVKQQAELAQTTAQRFQVALAALGELEASGKRLAELDLAEKLLGPDFAQQLRTGQTTVAQIIGELDRVQQKQLFNDADARRGLELSREIADTKRAIDEALATVIDLSKLAMSVDGIWLGILKTVRAAAEGSNQVIENAIKAIDERRIAQIQQLEATAQQLEASARGASDSGDTLSAEAFTRDAATARAAAQQLQQALAGVADTKIDRAIGEVGPPLRFASDAMEQLDRAAQEAANTVPGLDGALRNLGASAASAAAKIGSVADGIRALQGLNPDLGGALGYLDKVRQTQAVYAETLSRANADFDKSGDEAAKTKAVTAAMDEQQRTLKALATERDKPLASIVREGELAKLNDEDRAVAQVTDRMAERRRQIEESARVYTAQAATPADAETVRKQFDGQIAQLDAAEKALVAKARADAAAKTAKDVGGSGDDAFDNAIRRSKDQIEEYDLQASSAGRLTEEVYKLTEANRLRRAAASAGRLDEAGINDTIDAQAAAYAKARKASDDVTEAQRRMQDAFREGGSEIVDFLDQWLLKGGKFADVLKSATGTLASSSLRGLLTGEGMFGSFLGLAPTERGQMGGLLGGQFSLSKLLDTGGLKDAVGSGTFSGVKEFFGPLLQPKQDASGKTGGFASTPLGQGLGAAAAGGAVGYSTGSPLQGALAGGLAGLATGNPIAGLAGAAAGLLGGLFGQSQQKAAKKAAALQAQVEYATNRPQIEQLAAGLRGEATGGITGSIAQASSQVAQAGQQALKAGDTGMIATLDAAFKAFVERAYAVLTNTFEGTLHEMATGLGPNGPFSQAASAVAQLGETLKSFVKDAEGLPDGAANAARARAAAQEAALASLDAPKTLSDVQTRLASISGTSAGLRQVLLDLGMSADQAATAIRERATRAIDALRASFDDGLDRKINTAQGKDYLNSLADLVKERQGLLADAAALGTDGAKVETYFVSAAQKVIDDSELTGDAFTALTAAFPDLTGQVHAFTTAVDTAAARTAAAARALGYQDRLFAATNDTATLEGQLAAYDRKAEQERKAEVEAGGQALVDLEAAQSAERLKIVTDYYRAEADARAQALAQAKSAFDTWAKGIAAYRTGLLTGSETPLSPGDRLAAAQSAYDDTLAKARSGDRTALDGVTTAAEALRTAAQANFASSEGYQRIFAAIQSDLGALPDQVSPEQFLADTVTKTGADIEAATALMRDSLLAALRSENPSAIAGALQASFGMLDTSLDGLLSPAEFMAGLGPLATQDQQQAALAVFQSIDANGDGLISAIELMRQGVLAGLTANSPALVAQALSGRFDTLTATTGGLLSYGQLLAAVSPLATTAEQQAARAVFNAIDADGDGQISRLEVLQARAAETRDAASGTTAAVAASTSVLNDNLAAARATQQFQNIYQDSFGYLLHLTERTVNNLVSANQRSGARAYATGGWVSGSGSGTSDSIAARLSNGEFVVNAASARIAAPWLDAVNDNPGMVPALPVPVPMPMAGGGAGIDELLAEVRALRGEVKSLRTENKALGEMIGRVTKDGADRNVRAAERVQGEVAEGNADRRKGQRRAVTSGRATQAA